MITLADIEHAVTTVYGLEEHALRSPQRPNRIAIPRQMAFLLSRTVAKKTLPQIGAFYRRDHTTVMHGVRRANERLKDPEFCTRYGEVLLELRAMSRRGVNRFYRSGALTPVFRSDRPAAAHEAAP